MKSIPRISRLFSICLTSGSLASVAAADSPPVRIMPLGDSITLGCCSGSPAEGGYRTRLYANLANAGFNVDFVGTQKDANNPQLQDVDHEGHGGDRISDIRNGAGIWFKEAEDTDVILLHIGTNDFSASATLVETQNQLRGLLVDLTAAQPNAKIILSSLILRTDNAAKEALEEAFNQSLPGIVSEQVSLGRQVSLVDLHAILGADDLNEGIHPNPGGYDKMADGWLPAITNVITPLGTSNPPVISHVDARADLTHVRVTFSKPVEDAATTLSNFALSGGVSVLQAELDSATKRIITLTTSPQAEGAQYTLSVNGVRDRTPLQNAIPVGATREFTSRTLLDGSFEANAEGWTSGGSYQVADALPNTPATDGSKLMVFNGLNSPTDGVVSQTVATIPGEKYKLAFDVGVFGLSNNSQSLQVTVEGNNSPLLTQTEQVSGTASDATVWASKNYEFVANSNATSLTFADTSATTYNGDLLLDDVRLNLEVTPVLTVNSTPATGISVTVSPADLGSNGNGVTSFTRTYNESTAVNLTAPATSGAYKFQKWLRDGLDYSSSAATSVTMNANHTMSAVYNMLTNGGFETGDVVTGSVTALDNWTVTGSAIGYIEDPDYVAPEASRLTVFNGGGNVFGGTISQSFTTVPDQSYDIDYKVGIIGASGQKQRLQVDVTGTAPPLATDEVTAAAGPAQWTSRTQTFVAHSTTTVLTFTDISGTLGAQAASCDLLLDDVRVSVMTPNNAPVAANDSYSTNQNVALTVTAAGVLTNDTDPEFDGLAAVLVSGPSHGTLGFNANGGFSYTPATGYTGADSFTYKANDGALDSNVATVSLSVTVIPSSLLTNGSFENGAAVGGGATVLDNWTVTGSPFGYVADASYTATNELRLAVFNGAGDAFGGTISQTFATSPGATYDLDFDMGIFGAVGKKQRLQVDVTGTTSPLASEELTAAAGAAQWSAKHYTFVASGPTTTLTFTDASGALGAQASSCDLLLDHVRVSGAAPSNTAPVAAADSYSTTKNIQLVVPAAGVLSNDSDAELNALTAAVDAGPGHGSVTLNSNGGFTYTPANNYVGADSFTYHASDGSFNSNIVTVSITVNAPAPGVFTNGSFESGTTGWSVSGNHFVVTQDSSYVATDGTKLMVFNGGNSPPNAVVSQTFATTVGQSYVLEFDMGVLAANTSEQRLQVSVVGGATLVSQTESAFGNGQSNSVWVPKTFSFLADSTATTLTFTDLSPATDFVDLLLDHVRITPGSARTLTVTSSPVSSAGVTVSPADLNGSSSGTTNFTRSYTNGAGVNLTAPATVGAATFVKWQKDGADFSVNASTSVTMDANHTLNAVYFTNSAPVAVAESYSTNQNNQLAVPAAGVLSNDTDADSNPLTAVLNAGPANGTLTLNSNGSFTYTPGTNYQGSDSFTYHANDGSLDSNVVTVNISVVAPSLLANGSFESGTTGWTVFGNQLVVTSESPYLATDGTKLMVFNGGQSTPNAVISQTFATTPGQPYLLEFDMGVIASNTNEQQLNVTLTGGSALLSQTESAFGNGLGNAVWVTRKYSFVANSATTTVSLNDLSPSTNAIDLLLDNVRVTLGVSRTLTVISTPPTTATVVVSPADLSGNANGVTQFSRTYINGATVSLTAQAVAAGGNFLKWQKNGVDYSNNISTSVTIDANLTMNAMYAPNAAPAAVADSYSVNEDVVLTVPAVGVLVNDSDPESGTFTAILNAAPTHGNLALNADGSFTYTPAPNYHGVDSFTYHDSDGELSSGIVTVSLTVNPVNDAPVASGQSFGTDEDVAVVVSLVASDIDADTLSYPITAAPQHGTLSGTAPNLTYTPTANYNGSDSFTFVANDGTADSIPAVVAITIAPVTDAPIANAQSVSVVGGTSASVTLAGGDPDGDAVTFTVQTNPGHGTLSGTVPNLIYTPVANYQGTDSFTFVTNDGTSDSTPALVSITVNPVLVNGSFESGIAGWTATGNYQVVTSVTQPPNQRFSTDGTKLLVMNSGQLPPTAVISQSFPTVSGQPYVLTFDRGFQSFNTNTQRLQTTVVGSSTLVSDTKLLVGNSSGISVWTATSYSFIANSATTTLTFRDVTLSPDANLMDLLLDNVRITAQVTRTLVVASSPDSGVNVTVSPVDINGSGNGASGFTRVYLDAAVVNLTAPAAVGAMNFQKWQKNGVDLAVTAVTSVTMNANHTLTAVYIPNAPPLAVADSYSVNEDTTLVVPAATGVLANDSDPESVALTAVVDASPGHGSLTLNANGGFSYVSAANYHGPDSFTYHAYDGVVASTVRTVTLAVNSINDAPVAVADTYSTNEEVTLVVPAGGVLVNDTDIEADPLTAVLNVGPTHGTLTLNIDGSFSYAPVANYNGADSFTYHANDGAANSPITTVSITVNPINDAPVANAQTVNLNEDVPTAVVLVGTDVDGNTLGYSLVTGPLHGTLTGAAPNLTYSPVANYHGSDSFSFKVNDGTVDSGTATVSITVASINDAPVASAQTVNVNEDGSVATTLSGSDVDGDSLTFVAGTPSHGTLTGTAPNLTYTPTANYQGPDSFNFKTNDATVDSASALVSITVASINDAPVATSQSVNVNEDGSTAVTLAGTDVDGDSLTFVAGSPSHGTLAGTAPNLTYTPAANYHGPDSFSFKVNDSTVDSVPALVSITVVSVNDAPLASAQSLNVNEDGSVAITLSGTDVEGDSLTFAPASPTHGTLSGEAPNLTYTPAPNYHGSDGFSFTVNDGTVDSISAAVSISVVSINDDPVASADSFATSEDTELIIPTAGVLANDTDIDSDPLTSVLNAGPSHGSVTLNPNGSFSYLPALNYHGSDSFTYHANDGTSGSAVVTVGITVSSINDAPVATAQPVNVNEDGSVVVTLSGTDVDGDSLTFVAGLPAHGTLSGTAPNLTYTPEANYHSSDSFSFKANDGTVDSVSSLVSITVVPVNDTPVAIAQSVNVNEDGTVAITLSGTDVDGNNLTFSAGSTSHGNLTGTAPNLTYTPVANYHGPDSFSFKANDGTVDSASAVVSITVTSVNDAPVATAQSVNVNEDGSVAITLSGTDVDGDGLTFIAGSASHGTLTGTLPVLTYTPVANYRGADSFSFVANDGAVDSASSAVSITVVSINDAPLASAQSVNVNEDGPKAVTLAGTDMDGDSLAFTAGSPSHGTLTGTAPNLTYTPAANYHGSDSFSFTVNDGTLESASALVTITVDSINDTPVATAQSVNLDEDTSKVIMLAGTDIDGDSLTFSVTVPPLHGALSGTAPNLTYTPAPDYNGADSFIFVANDGTANSAPSAVLIAIVPVDDNRFGEWLASFGLAGDLGDDPDHDSLNNALEYVVGGNPANHADNNLMPVVSVVTADPDGNSVSSSYLCYTYRRTDLARTDPNTVIQVQWDTGLSGGWTDAGGTPGVVILESDNAAGPATDLVAVYIPRSLAVNNKLFVRLAISLEVAAPVNLPPAAQNQSVTAGEDASVPIALGANDPNGDPLTFIVVNGPQHGNLSGTAPNLTYTPASNYHGSDSFTFKANDGITDSAPATVSIIVNSQEEFSQWMSSFGLSAGQDADSDGDSISNLLEYVIGGNPANHADLNLLPGVSMATADPDENSISNDYMVFTYRRSDLAGTDPSMAIKVEWVTNLGGAWTNADGTEGVVTLQSDNLTDAGVDVVSVYIPRSLAVDGKLFVRLNVAVATP